MTGKYPYEEGETIVLGPEVFATADGGVVCWKGENYVKQVEAKRLREALAVIAEEHDDLPRLVAFIKATLDDRADRAA